MPLKQELPQYRSHKIVRGAKIIAVDYRDDSMDVVLNLGAYGTVETDRHWMREKHAEVGGYYVVYEDGYSSWSPAQAFEQGHTQVE